MPSRRTTALSFAALVLAPVLSSCGFDYATDRDYTPGVGADNREGTVDVLGSVVVSDRDGRGVLVASFSNGSSDENIQVTGVTGGEGLKVAEFDEIDLAPQGFESLADGDTPIKVSGDLEKGSFVELTVEFSNGESSRLSLPVVGNCGYYAEVTGLPAGDETCETGHDAGDHGEGGH